MKASYIVFVVAMLLLYIAVSIFIGPEENKSFHFSEEEGVVTTLSAIMLAFASAGAIICFFIQADNRDKQKFFWLLTGLGFFFFSFDEQFGFHEKFGRLFTREIGGTEGFRNWNDVIVIGYGLVAIPVILYFIPEVLRLPNVAELLGVAFGSYVLHTLIDSTQERATVTMILEESCKLFASSFFAFAMIVAALTVANDYKRRAALAGH